MSQSLLMKDIMSHLFSVRGMAKVLSLTAVFAMSTAIPAHAASACKGKSKIMCESSNSCSFVKAHKRKNGDRVKAFCRSKPRQSKATSKRAAYKKSSSKKMTLMDEDDAPTSKKSKTSKTSKKSKTSKTPTKPGAKKKAAAKKSAAKKAAAKKKTTAKKTTKSSTARKSSAKKKVTTKAKKSKAKKSKAKSASKKK